MDPKPPGSTKYNTLAVAAAGCTLLLAAACICVLLAGQAGADITGGVWDWITGLFRRKPAGELTLRQALEDGLEADFRLAGPCSFTYTQGARLNSTLEDGLVQEMAPEKVRAMVLQALQGMVFEARDGRLALATGEPVEATLLAGEAVAVNLRRQPPPGEEIVSESLEGVVEGQRFRSSYHLERSRSAVVNGQGIETAETVIAELTCHLTSPP